MSGNGAPPAISLVTGTLGRRDVLERLLGSLRRQSFGAFEVILVDQNEPGYLDPVLAGFADLDLVRLGSPKGLSLARNVGLRSCRGEIVGFPDDDCWYGPELLRSVSVLLPPAGERDFVLGRTVDAQGRDSLGQYPTVPEPITRLNVWTAGNSNGLFIRTGAARRIGGFDEELGVGARTPYQSGEETDFLLRCLADGQEGLFDPDLRVFHEQVGRLSPEAHLKRVTQYSRGYGRVLRKNGYGRAAVLERALRSAGSGLFAAARGRTDEARQKLSWARGAVSGYFGLL